MHRLDLPLPLVALRLHVVERRFQVREALLGERGAGLRLDERRRLREGALRCRRSVVRRGRIDAVQLGRLDLPLPERVLSARQLVNR